MATHLRKWRRYASRYRFNTKPLKGDYKTPRGDIYCDLAHPPVFKIKTNFYHIQIHIKVYSKYVPNIYYYCVHTILFPIALIVTCYICFPFNDSRYRFYYYTHISNICFSQWPFCSSFVRYECISYVPTLLCLLNKYW